MAILRVLSCLDSGEAAVAIKRMLDIARPIASQWGKEAVEAIRSGFYLSASGTRVDWAKAVSASVAGKKSIAPEAPLPTPGKPRFAETQVQVSNETTLTGGARLVAEGLRPLALNFANGIRPGGGFHTGAKAQEEALCRSSALFATLEGDAMYEAHKQRPQPDSTDWAILSPSVPVFRSDDGSALDQPWLLSFISSAAPVATHIGKAESARLMDKRIRRILSIARAYGYESLVLGAWGCGAFGNDGKATAISFRTALESEFAGAFAKVLFAITDWSPDRAFIGPFKETFNGA